MAQYVRRACVVDPPAGVGATRLARRAGTDGGQETATPVSNTGGKYLKKGKTREKPEIVTQGCDGEHFPVVVDWLTLTVKGSRFNECVHSAGRYLERWSGGVLTIGGKLEKHYNGYSQCWGIRLLDVGKEKKEKDADKKKKEKVEVPPLGWVGISVASDNMCGWWCFNLTGTACSLVRDWSPLVRDMAELHGRITRVDLALDDLAGFHPISEAENAYQAGLFGVGGRLPKAHILRHLGPGAGRDGDTFYVGKRDSGKMLRVYEKGKQLGDAASAWVRYEGELHGRDRVIPWEILLLPAQYLRGMYPKALAWMRFATARVIEVLQLKGRIALERALLFARRQTGRLMLYLREHLGLLDSEIISKLIVEGGAYPARLFMPPDVQIMDDSEIETWLEACQKKESRQLSLSLFPFPSCIVRRARGEPM